MKYAIYDDAGGRREIWEPGTFVVASGRRELAARDLETTRLRLSAALDRWLTKAKLVSPMVQAVAVHKARVIEVGREHAITIAGDLHWIDVWEGD